ncbi:MAG: low molecular weight phosphotyrosine protein phosphatase [Thermomonas sp.]|uniref:low molecular weight protein-tyrosine-phosphatase n=1 Tax=Thermomonas sp. TaxID=1971895 RepID=UPI0026285C04|nr:low molecular weight protein-tyrosine-phosphatase [Thermomonas sp.]MCC7096084.1 low molecular weight phosphotyrosine protein phosphatase [Thermomonas sp.]
MVRPYSILMVCMGNICRSPTAEGVLRARLDASDFGQRVRVDSAGTGDSHVGCAPDPRAIECALRNGVDISAQRARRLSYDDFESFDLLLCADRTILHETRIRKPRTAHADVELLLEWAGVGNKDVPDPYYGNAKDFERAFKLIDAAATGIVKRLHEGRS